MSNLPACADALVVSALTSDMSNALKDVAYVIARANEGIESRDPEVMWSALQDARGYAANAAIKIARGIQKSYEC